MGTFSIMHWLVVLAVVLLLFGGRGKISSIMGDFGKGLRSFKTGLKGDEQDADGAEDDVEVIEETPAPAKKATTRKKAPAKKAPAKKKAAKKKVAKKKAQPLDNKKAHVTDRGTSIVMQASSHVTGTADRSALIAWLLQSWSKNRQERLFRELENIGWTPGHLWSCDGRLLIIIPLAIPKKNMMRHLKSLGLARKLAQFEKLGHSWTGVSPRRWENGEQEPEFEYQGVIPFDGDKVNMPLSNPHLELIQRLGGLVEVDDLNKFEFAGTGAPTLRIANHK